MEMYEPVALLDWLLPQPDGLGFLLSFLIGSLVLLLTAYFLCVGVAALRYGMGEGFYIVSKTVATGMQDLMQFSPRRVLAMTRLAIQESLRRRVLITFAVFIVGLLFAGWFLDTESDSPGPLYLDFVLTSTNYLVLVLALFLSTFSLPNDIKTRTIYTVVTKPVRAVEIVLGRIFGFAAVATVLLVLMCGISYVFVVRGVSHEHAVDPDAVPWEGSQLAGETSHNWRHRHRFTVDPHTGLGETDVQRGHRHEVRRVERDGQVHYEVGPPIGMLQARVPIYGRLRFLDRAGQLSERGVNVGYEWAYRSFIQGATPMAAIWRFDGLREERFPDGLPLELNLRVFRTHKGDIEQTVRGTIELINPANPQVRSAPIPFFSQEFTTQELTIPLELEGINAQGQIEDLDLFRDLVSDNQVDLQIRCRDRGQFFGMAQPDVYVRAADQYFFVNFIKGYTSIWLQMIMVTCFGVMFSTFLSGAVAMLATLSSMVIGFFTQKIMDLAAGAILGGGPLESFVRIVTQLDMMSDLDDTAATRVIQTLDGGFMTVLKSLAQMLPNYNDFHTAGFVAHGYNIDAALMAQQFIVTVAYLVVVSIVGYFLLKTREIAA